jgi:hypothetical protein
VIKMKRYPVWLRLDAADEIERSNVIDVPQPLSCKEKRQGFLVAAISGLVISGPRK